MRYGIALPNYGPLAGPDVLVRVARHAEACGADSVWVSDHVIIPSHIESMYPYDRSTQRSAANLDNLETFYDALTTLAFIAGATTSIRLGVSVYVVPLRNPLLTAKIVASLDALSNGRVIFGCGVGWLREEFDALHADFEARGALTDEYLRICQTLWTRGVVECTGPHYVAAAVRGGPAPRQTPYPPIWIGGNGRAALARVARLGNGWHPIDLTPDEIVAQLKTLQGLCAAADRRLAEITISVRRNLRFLDAGRQATEWLTGTAQKIRNDVAAYAAAGVDYLVLNLRHATSVDEILAQLDRVATDVFS
jgi:probable F420-dependent oxidoreductase